MAISSESSKKYRPGEGDQQVLRIVDSIIEYMGQSPKRSIPNRTLVIPNRRDRRAPSGKLLEPSLLGSNLATPTYFDGDAIQMGSPPEA